MALWLYDIYDSWPCLGYLWRISTYNPGYNKTSQRLKSSKIGSSSPFHHQPSTPSLQRAEVQNSNLRAQKSGEKRVGTPEPQQKSRTDFTAKNVGEIFGSRSCRKRHVAGRCAKNYFQIWSIYIYDIYIYTWYIYITYITKDIHRCTCRYMHYGQLTSPKWFNYLSPPGGKNWLFSLFCWNLGV